MKTPKHFRSVAIIPIIMGIANFANPCSATLITGNPFADAWTYVGNSASPGNFNTQSGGAIYSADIYTTLFPLTASPLAAATGWGLGDTIVGVGGVFTVTGNTTLTYDGAGGATDTRIVVKYGSPTATWQPNSPNPGSPGYGSLANGGVGSVLLGTFAYTFSPAFSGQFAVPNDSPEVQLSGSTASINPSVGRDITSWTGNTLTGFETFLDLTLLKAQVPNSNVLPGNKFILDLQDDRAEFQDSQATLPTPEPTSTALLGFGCLLLALNRRHRIMA